MKNRTKFVIALFLILIGVGFVFGSFAQAAWIEGTIGYIKQVRVDDITINYELRLDPTGGGAAIYRNIYAEELNQFLAIALSAQAGGSTVVLQHETNAAGKGWYGIILVSP